MKRISKHEQPTGKKLISEESMKYPPLILGTMGRGYGFDASNGIDPALLLTLGEENIKHINTNTKNEEEKY